MSSSRPRRVVGSLALAAVASASLLSAAPALAGEYDPSDMPSETEIEPGDGDGDGDGGTPAFTVGILTSTGTTNTWQTAVAQLPDGISMDDYVRIEFMSPQGWKPHDVMADNGWYSAHINVITGTYALGYVPYPGATGPQPIEYRLMVNDKQASAVYIPNAEVPAPTPVTPREPTVVDAWGTFRDGVIIPSTPGVSYRVDGEHVGDGLYHTTKAVTVTAEALTNFVFTEGAVTSWSWADFESTAAVDLTSSGVSGATQKVTVAVPEDADVTLMDSSDGGFTVATDEGHYEYDGHGEIGFAPATGFSGTAEGVQFKVTWGEETSTARYIPTVDPTEVTASAPTWNDFYGTANDTYTLTEVTGVEYLVDGVVKGKGTYPATGEVTVTARATQGHTLTDGTHTWTRTFSSEELKNSASSDKPGVPQSVTIEAPAGYGVTLYDDIGHGVENYLVAGQGRYRLEGTVITFTPEPGFTGKAHPVRFGIVNAHGTLVTAEYTATVDAQVVKPPVVDAPVVVKPVVTAPKVTATTPARTVHAKQLTTTCVITGVKAKGCTVTAYATINGKKTKVGAGKVTTKGTASSVEVPVALTKTGRTLAARPQGVVITLETTMSGTDKKTYKTTARTTVVAPVVKARSIHFKADSAKLTATDRAYLTALRTQLKGVKAITVTGYADSRAPKHYNTALGKARANAVAKLLSGTKSATGSKVKITVQTKGEKNPAASNLTRDGRAQNRRAEVQIKF